MSLISICTLFHLLLHCSHGSALDLQQRKWSVGQVVETSSGVVEGHAASIPGTDVGDVSEYLGIRFGQNTAGKNRFRPAKEYKSTKPLDGANFVSCHNGKSVLGPNLYPRALHVQHFLSLEAIVVRLLSVTVRVKTACL
jgi:hypothetical protein